MDALPVSLLDLLSNSLVLRQTSPYIPVRDLLSLSTTSKALQSLVLTSPEATQYLDVSPVQSAVIDSSPIDSGGISWRAERMDEALTEDEFYCGPLRGIFSKCSRMGFLTNVSTLILDGLSVPADLVREIIMEERFNVKMLSIRECKHLNDRKLNQVLRYAVRPSRPAGTPKLRALYVFGPRDLVSKVQSESSAKISSEWNQRSTATLSSELGQPEDRWYRAMGRVMKQPASDWPDTLKACEGIIAFDAVLCRGPRHDATSPHDYLQPAIATVALGPDGCQTCSSCPEQPARFGTVSEGSLPLLAPPPLHSSTVKSAQRPSPSISSKGVSSMPSLILRCEDCLRSRWCERCNKWWCETCYGDPVSRDAAMYNLAAGNESMSGTAMQSYTSHENRDRGGNSTGPVKVYLNLCVESCYHREVWPTIDGNWG